jgi:hypothetical protein
MQHKITQPSKLLNKQGELIQTGYATTLILDYNRQDVRARRLRLKEWDYYLIYNDDYGIAITVGKTVVFGLISVTFIDFKNKTEHTKSKISFVPFGQLAMPKSSETGTIFYKDKNVYVSIKSEVGKRILKVKMKNFYDGSDLLVYLKLNQESKETMVVANPFKEDPKAFYYNQKIIGMKALGKILFNNKTHFIKPMDSAFGLLDWGRGVWPYKSNWYWSAAQGIIDDKKFGFNLGYGSWDTSAANENMLFYDNKAYKLNDVLFIIPKKSNNEYDYMKPWIITSSDQHIELVFIPLLNRRANVSAGIVSSNQNQVFGFFTGRAIIDEQNVLPIRDLFGFAETVENHW